MAKHDITQDLLNRLFVYDEGRGSLTWKWRPRCLFDTDKGWRIANKKCAGKIADCVSFSGYSQVNVFGKIIPAHRVIWMMVFGEWPDGIDHINGVKHDNRRCNLRNVSQAENTRNAARRSDNVSGVTGVYMRENGRQWRAKIGSTNLGTFNSFDEAVAVRAAAMVERGFHANHGR